LAGARIRFLAVHPVGYALRFSARLRNTLRRPSPISTDWSSLSSKPSSGHDEPKIAHLVELCQKKLTEYEAKRGEQIWQHRKLSSGYISGTLRFEVLKKAQFHCELCGISAAIRALEVDHIVPRNLGGTDDPNNLQALCYSCNSMKRDKILARYANPSVSELTAARSAICPVSAFFVKTSWRLQSGTRFQSHRFIRW
jgi:5-methylcytosine-specific restriction endonuclease McrA